VCGQRADWGRITKMRPLLVGQSGQMTMHMDVRLDGEGAHPRCVDRVTALKEKGAGHAL